jgi:hypothetical protein
VTAIFKKGDESLTQNYRPISLLSVSYKVVASLILNRMSTGRVEEKLRDTQFGFQKQRRSTDAIFLVQRAIERTWASKDGQLSAILLDWSKAFDRIDPAALQIALARFGIPRAYCDMVKSIYTNRAFDMTDSHGPS